MATQFCFSTSALIGRGNYRKPFLLKDFDGFDREVWPQVHFVSLTQYDVRLPAPFIFPQQELRSILAEVVSAAGKSQLRIAETEKYAHVTYFLNGGIEKPCSGRRPQTDSSPRVATYDLKPEMSAFEVTDEVLALMANYDLIVLNFANPDMVGHTGVVKAGIKAVETVDDMLAANHFQTSELRRQVHWSPPITETASRCATPTAHRTPRIRSYLVHFIYVAKDAAKFRCEDGILADVAPTLTVPARTAAAKEMTGHNLLVLSRQDSYPRQIDRQRSAATWSHPISQLSI